MAKIPIVFSFDDQMKIPAGVCIFSLLERKNKDTFYDIHILYIKLQETTINYIKKLEEHFSDCSIQFFCVKDYLDSGYEVRGISKSTYSRLLIPRLFKNYKRILYSDVDIVFTDDLSNIFELPITDFKIAGVIAPTIKKKYIHKIGVKGDYVNAGFLLFNNEAITAQDVDKTIELVKTSKFKYLDQDIINIVYGNFIYSKVNPRFNISPKKILDIAMGTSKNLINSYGEEGLSAIKSLKGVIHYVGTKKPWEHGSVPLGEIWWEIFRNSIYYDADYFINFLKTYKKLSLKSRIKHKIKKKIKKLIS